MTALVDTLQVISETATLEKREVLTGRVRVTTHTETRDELVSAELERRDVALERVAIGREVDVAPQVRVEDGVTIVPVVEEILVVEKRLFLKEEIRIRQTTVTESVDVPLTLRQQRAVIERDDLTANLNEEDT